MSFIGIPTSLWSLAIALLNLVAYVVFNIIYVKQSRKRKKEHSTLMKIIVKCQKLFRTEL